MSRDLRRNGHDRDLQADLVEATASIVAKCGDPARVLEFYYWSRQTGLADLIRAFLRLPADTRTVLGAFLTTTPDLQRVCTRAQVDGQLTLSPSSTRAPGVPHEPKAKK